LAPEEHEEFAALPVGVQMRLLGWLDEKRGAHPGHQRGFSRPLHSFAVTIGPGVPPRLIRFDGDPGPAGTWQIFDLTYDRQFAAAVAVSNVQAIVHPGHLLHGRRS